MDKRGFASQDWHLTCGCLTSSGMIPCKPITNILNPICPFHPIIPLGWNGQYGMISYKPITNTLNPICSSHPIVPLGWNKQYGMIPYKPIANTLNPCVHPILSYHWDGMDNMG